MGLACSLANGGDQGLLIRKLSGLMAREDELVIYRHIENTTGTANERRIHIKIVFQLGSQTDRLGLIASTRAILDFDIHGSPPEWWLETLSR